MAQSILADKKYALITGASSGIGLEFARLFAASGWGLLLVARDQKRLDEVRGELQEDFNADCRVVCADLSLPDAATRIGEGVRAEKIQIHALINCAGFTAYGEFSSSELETQLRMIQVNASALTSLTRIFLPAMVARKSGWIMNVASTAAFRPGPLQAVYYATKGYVLLFTEALANELKGSGVTVTCLCPGATDTDFFRRAHINVPQSLRNNLMSARDVARIGYRAMVRGKTVVVPGLLNKISVFAMRILPRSAVSSVMRRVMDGVRSDDVR